MNLIVYAVPFFIFAILAELAYGLWSGRNTYRLNDSFSSLSLGVLSQARRYMPDSMCCSWRSYAMQKMAIRRR